MGGVTGGVCLRICNTSKTLVQKYGGFQNVATETPLFNTHTHTQDDIEETYIPCLERKTVGYTFDPHGDLLT